MGDRKSRKREKKVVRGLKTLRGCLEGSQKGRQPKEGREALQQKKRTMRDEGRGRKQRMVGRNSKEDVDNGSGERQEKTETERGGGVNSERERRDEVNAV